MKWVKEKKENLIKHLRSLEVNTCWILCCNKQQQSLPSVWLLYCSPQSLLCSLEVNSCWFLCCNKQQHSLGSVWLLHCSPQSLLCSLEVNSCWFLCCYKQQQSLVQSDCFTVVLNRSFVVLKWILAVSSLKIFIISIFDLSIVSDLILFIY